MRRGRGLPLGPSAGLDAAGGLEPACMRGLSPVLSYWGQLVGLLINTLRARRRDEILSRAGSSTSESH